MVSKIFKFFNKEFNGINEAALLLGAFTFLSQILALFRDRFLAQIVGPGPNLDVYYAAFRIPDLLYVSIASLASITVLMPFIVKKIKFNENREINDKCDKKEAKEFLNNVFSVFMFFMVIVSIIIYILMPFLVKYIAPGFSEDQIHSLIKISRLMLLSPIFIGVSNLIGTITQLFKNFFIFSLSPVFYNTGIILGILIFYKRLGITGLALGVILGAILHFLIQLPTVIYHNFAPKFTFKIDWKEILEVVKISLPRTITLSTSSLAFMFLIAMASKLKAGSISLFTFSYSLQSVPLGIIGVSYSVAAFPVLVKSFSLKDMDNFIKHIISAVKQIIFWSLPVIVLTVVLRAQIVRVILGSKTFSWTNTRLTAASVALFMISLVTQSLVLLIIRGYYASGNTKRPLLVNIFSSLMIIIFAFLLINLFKIYPETLIRLEKLLRVEGVSGTNMLALPIAFTLGSILNFFLIWRYFKKDFLGKISFGIRRSFFQVLFSSLTIGIVSYLMLNIFDDIFNLNTFMGIFLQGLFSGLIGIISGFFVLYLTKNKELFDLIKALRNKFWKKDILSPEQQGL